MFDPLWQEATCDPSARAHAPVVRSPEPVWHVGLTLKQVRSHLIRLVEHLTNGAPVSGDPTADRAERVQRGMEACRCLLAKRAVLAAAIDTQQRVDRLVHLSEGRGLAGDPDGLAALHRRQQHMQQQVADALAQWRSQAGRFTQLTHLLPTQLAPPGAWLDRQTPTDWQRQIEMHVRGGTGVSHEAFDAALTRCMRAQRVSDSAVAVSMRSLEALAAANLGWRLGQLRATAVADAQIEAFEDLRAVIEAEAARASAADRLEDLTGR